MLLAIDTSAGTSVAVVDDDARVLAESSIDDTMRHAEVIGAAIARVLDESRISARQVGGVAVGMGPGPFTGLRVGIAAARAFAFGRSIATLPVVSHDAVALAAFDDGFGPDLLVVTDARRRELYWSVYDAVDSDGLPARVDGPGLSKPDEIDARVALQLGAGAAPLVRLDARTVSAGAVGRIAALARAAGRAPADDTALYLRSPDVTLSAGPKRVTA